MVFRQLSPAWAGLPAVFLLGPRAAALVIDGAGAPRGGPAPPPPCDDTPIPNPYSKQALLELYDREGLLSQAVLWLEEPLFKRWGAQRRSVWNWTADCENAAAFRRLLADGLVVNTFGMDFTPVQARRYGFPSARGDELTTDADADRIWNGFYKFRVTKFFWHVDLPSYYRPMPVADGLTASEREMVSMFRRDGVLTIDEWPLDFKALMREHVDTFGGWGSDMSAWQEFHVIKSLDTLLQRDSLLWKLLFGYLGDNVQYDGALTLRLKSSATTKNYPNGPWHHDGCGQRIKAFIFLNDVNEDTPATRVIPGTHHMQYFPTTQIGSKDSFNKLNSTTVLDLYGSEFRTLHGRAGGGFIFDTNMLHSTDLVAKTQDRDVVILEFARVEHMERIPRGHPIPEDNFMSWFRDGQCPQTGRAGPKFTLRVDGNKTMHTRLNKVTGFEEKVDLHAGPPRKHWVQGYPDHPDVLAD